MNIAAYCRVSTDKEDQLNSLETQKKFFTEYTQRTGDTLTSLYADEGISGTKIKNRKEFQRMMADAERHRFERVVVKDISRFARNTVDLLQSVRRLKELGIDTQFLTANMTSMGDSEFVLTLFGALAQEESANTSKRIKFSKKINAEKGKVPNLVFGYDKTIGDYFHLSVNETEAATVRQIFRWYTEEGCGAGAIAGLLNRQGKRTKRGCQWSQNAVCRILTNPIYTGKIINGKQEIQDFLTGKRVNKAEEDWLVAERPELRILEPGVFEEAQRILSERHRQFNVNHERASNKYLFSTLIKCKECGWSFHRSQRTFKNTHIRWGCSKHTRKEGDRCPNAVTVPEEELTQALQSYFTRLLENREAVVDKLVREFERTYRNKDENRSDEKKWRAQLAKLQKTRQKYMDMYTDDLISREELNEKLSALKEEIARTEKSLNIAERNLTKGQQLASILHQTFQNLGDVADVSQMTNAQLKHIVKKIEVDGEGNIDIFLQLPDELGLEQNVLLADGTTQRRLPAAEAH